VNETPADLHRAGRISAEVALARLVLAGLGPRQIIEQLNESGHPALARIALERRADLARLRAFVDASGVDHAAVAPDEAGALAAIRALFDRAAALSPEAGVAAYSLGDPRVLDAATAELVAWLKREGLLGPDVDVLDLGCGIGRVAAAIAPHARSVLGLDISPAMIAEARRRHFAANLRFEVTDGAGLAAVPTACQDLVLAVDSFPYLVQAGATVGERHVAAAARILRPGGTLAVLNLSYRGLDRDRADAARWAAAHGFRQGRDGETPFTLWDGAVFLFHRAADRAHGA
jgi:SAM-dependent methyltransferase